MPTDYQIPLGTRRWLRCALQAGVPFDPAGSARTVEIASLWQ